MSEEKTSYEEIYDEFLSKVTDDLYVTWTPDIDEKTEEEAWDKDAIYSDLSGFLKTAIRRFFLPKEDIYTVVTEEGKNYFSSALSQATIDILVLLMVREWLARQMNNVRITEIQYTGSDAKAINTKSQAEAIKVAQDANEKAIKEAYYLYDYQDFDEKNKMMVMNDPNLTSKSSVSTKVRKSRHRRGR